MININIEQINEQIQQNPKQVVSLAEQYYANLLEEVAQKIENLNVKILLISGPSSAGKTTTSFRLQERLRQHNIPSHVLNMDDFFIDANKIPVRPDGEPDIESLQALDVECIKKCLGEILEKNETKTPQFDFATHTRLPEWVECKLNGNEVIIMEGIHAHNPKIVEGLSNDRIYKIYLDCDSKFFINGEDKLSSREIRLLRRMIRDARDRDVPYLESIEMWKEVCVGEDKNILPYKPSANFVIDTVFSYELSLFKFEVESKFKQYQSISPVISKYLDIFSHCQILNEDLIPDNSLLREFIGGLKLD